MITILCYLIGIGTAKVWNDRRRAKHWNHWLNQSETKRHLREIHQLLERLDPSLSNS